MTAESHVEATVAIPVLNEEAALGECLARLGSQTFPRFEVVVADGGSTDGTVAIAETRSEVDPRVRVISNPRRFQSAGLNEILKSTSSPFVVRLDARSFVHDDYVERCLDLLRSTGAAVVGGRMVPRSDGTRTQRAIARANAAWWGAGPARFHRAGDPGPAETVYLGAFDRRWLDLAGGWAEDVGVNEDYELNHRIRQLGGVVWLDPSLMVGYQPRTTLTALARQYVRYGRSKATVIRRHPASTRWRQVLPTVVLPTAVVAATPTGFGSWARLALALYLAIVSTAALYGDGPISDRFAAAKAALTMHGAWCAGFWYGLLRPVPSAAKVTMSSLTTGFARQADEAPNTGPS